MDFDKDWKKKVGFPINYNSGQSSDDDIVDVVMRRPRKSEVLLADGGDGAEADLLGTTPPRERIRFKQKRKMYLESAMGRGGEARRAVDDMVLSQPISPGTERLKKRLSVKMMRSKERDWKQDLSLRDSKADSLPSPNPIPTGPTVVESCNRFMSLTSKLKCREACPEFSESSSLRDELPPSRVDFHNTFSLLINMGNVDKGCRRTISREEQVWQNELKDLIWLELQAKLAGRSLAQQDAFLCKQRLIVPTVIHNIRNYCFVNPNPCRASSRRPCVIDGSREDLTEQSEESDCKEADDGNAGAVLDCLAFNCQQCSDAIGKALREVGTLLDSLFNAIALYPSTKAMTLEYPLVATLLFQNRVKAMCLWYNTAMHMRLKVIAVRRMLRSVRRGRSAFKQLPSVDSDVSRQSTDKPCQVRFNVSNTPTDSNNSESSVQSEGKEEVRGEEKEKEGEKEQGDEVDCASKSYSSEQAEPTTPEIIISADNNGTADTVGSNESGYSTSADVAERRELELEHEHVFDVGSLHELTKLRVLDKCAVSPYRSYHHEMLKTQGVRRCMVFMNKIRRNLLSKVFLTLEKPISIKPQTIPEEEQDPAEVFDDTKEEEEKGDEEDQDASNYELRRYGCWSEESLAMRLPSYRNHFLLLSTVCMEAVHDYLSLRLEDRPENPSCLTVKQLIHDLKEGLDIATEMRAAFVRNIEVALAGHRAGSRARHDLLLIIRTFDATIETVLKQYLSYVVKMSATEHMSRASLQAEWSFTARLAKRITCAKLNAPRTFTRARIPRHDLPPCWFVLAFFETTTTIVLAFFDTMAPSAMEIERNETKMAGCRRAPAAGVRPAACLLDYPLGALLYIRPQPEVMYVALNYYRLGISEIACNQLNRLNEQYDEKLRQVNELSKHTSVPTLQMVYAMCRSAQAIYSSEREATLQAAQWARALAARLACRKQYNALRADIFNSLMALRDCVVKHTLLILERSRIPPSENYVDMEAASARVRELLLQVYKVGFELHKELYKLAQAPFAQELLRSRRRPASLQPPRPAPLPRAPAGRRRPDTVLIHESLNPALHKELQRLVTERFPATTRRSISHPRRLLRADSIGEDVDYNAFDDRLLDNYATDGQTQTQTSIELLLSGQGQGQGQGQRQQEVEHRGEAESAALLSEEERRWAVLVARAVVQFARCWMTFVVERCDTGRGRRPRWASQGLEFLMLACDPCNTKHLSDEEFEELKKEMDGCISHVIGSRPAAAARAQDNIVMSPCSTRRRKISGPLSTSREPRETPPPPSPPTDPDPDPLLAFTPTEPAAHRTRVLEAIKQLDCCRDEKLREMRTVGHVLEAAVASYEPKLRQLKFKWQRGLKIGAGTFGKVYTVVNTESGQLLAMKEISVGAGDRRAMQRAANELRVLEGAAHPHLVRYYGCELHREEMLIFMELCVEGSLEALVATSGALAEHTVRRYSKQLVSAVAELHARSIAHRDIKSGNIFLTNEGHCLKLGDFGSAAKIRANTTAAGELQGYVGTQAYMAPEVFMKSTGHGRAADVWSLGCVVTEMATGKRPFSEYDSNYQIMFVVGMGGRPTIPETLSEEGQQFCLSCLTHEPELRPKAEALSLHHFLMVKSDEDCNCEPAYLIASPTY